MAKASVLTYAVSVVSSTDSVYSVNSVILLVRDRPKPLFFSYSRNQNCRRNYIFSFCRNRNHAETVITVSAVTETETEAIRLY